jgi:predicted metal-dependent peptidase
MKSTPVPNVPKRSEAPTEEQKRLTLKRLSRARLTVASFCRFFGHLILKTTPFVAMPEHNVDTAAVAPDGSMYFNAHFVATLTDPELCGLVIHETLHPALLCWKRQGNRNAVVVSQSGRPYTLWNVAHDLSFNPEIEDLANKCMSNGLIKLPKDAAIDPKYAKMSAEKIYNLLLEQVKKNPPAEGGGESGSGKGNPWGSIGTLDAPGMNGKGTIGDDLRDDLATTEVGKKAAKGDKLAQQKLGNDWRVNVVAASIAHEKKHGRGHLPAGFQKIVDELQTSKVDWRDVLSAWIGEKGVNLDFSWRRISRRSESAGVPMPGYCKYGIDDVIILWDTSGSMNGRETEILSEVRAICEDLGLVLRVICCDAAIHSDTHDVKQAIDMLGQIKGGGGSDFTPAFTLLEEERYEGVVVAFTDGAIGVPATKPPLIKDVLWVLKGKSHDCDPTRGAWGDVLLMDN